MNAVAKLPVKALCKAGFARTLLKTTRGLPAILMYHGVCDEARDGLTDCDGKHVGIETFRRHLQLLEQSRTVVPLAELVNALRTGSDDRNLVAITFDDGYLDNVTCAGPVLTEFGFAATFFLATGFIGANRWMWTDRLESALQRSALQEFSPEALGRSISLADLAAKIRALHAIKKVLKEGSWAAAEQSVINMERDLKVEPIDPWGLYRFMSWDDVRLLNKAGFEIGAHTVNHAILSRVPGPEAEQEILQSREDIAREIGECSPIFCYPNGKRSDFTAANREFCGRHFAATLSTIKGSARSQDLFELHRLAVDNATSSASLASMLVQAGYE